jgi:hypothetical protein
MGCNFLRADTGGTARFGHGCEERTFPGMDWHRTQRSRNLARDVPRPIVTIVA